MAITLERIAKAKPTRIEYQKIKEMTPEIFNNIKFRNKIIKVRRNRIQK